MVVNLPGKTRVDLEIYVGLRLVLGIVGFAGEMYYGIHLRHPSRIEIVPSIGLHHPLFHRSDNIESVNLMASLQRPHKITPHKSMYSRYK